MMTQPTKVKLRKKSDLVQVIAGRDKGKTGKILKVDRQDGPRSPLRRSIWSSAM